MTTTKRKTEQKQGTKKATGTTAKKAKIQVKAKQPKKVQKAQKAKKSPRSRKRKSSSVDTYNQFKSFLVARGYSLRDIREFELSVINSHLQAEVANLKLKIPTTPIVIN